MKRSLVPMVIALVSVSCSPGTASSEGSDAEANTKLTLSPPEDPRLGPGDAATTTKDGNTLEVISYLTPISLTGARPDPGSEFSAIEVEGCAGSTSGRDLMHVGPGAFRLQFPDGTSVKPVVFADADAEVREPALRTTDPKPGTCARGFVTFQTRRNERPELLVFMEEFADDTAEFAWSIPQG